MNNHSSVLMDASAFLGGTLLLSKTALIPSLSGSSHLLAHMFVSIINASTLNFTSDEPTLKNAAFKLSNLACGTFILIALAKPFSHWTRMKLSPLTAIQLAVFHGCLKVALYGIRRLYSQKEKPLPPPLKTPPPLLPKLPETPPKPSLAPEEVEPPGLTTAQTVLAMATIVFAAIGVGLQCCNVPSPPQMKQTTALPPYHLKTFLPKLKEVAPPFRSTSPGSSLFPTYPLLSFEKPTTTHQITFLPQTQQSSTAENVTHDFTSTNSNEAVCPFNFTGPGSLLFPTYPLLPFEKPVHTNESTSLIPEHSLLTPPSRLYAVSFKANKLFKQTHTPLRLAQKQQEKKSCLTSSSFPLWNIFSVIIAPLLASLGTALLFTKKINLLQKEKAELETDKEQLERENTALKTELKSEKSRADSLEADAKRVSGLKINLKSAENQKRKLNTKLYRQQEALDDLSEERARLIETVRKAQVQIARLQAENEGLMGEVEGWKSKVSGLTSKTIRLLQELNAKNSQISSLQKKVEKESIHQVEKNDLMKKLQKTNSDHRDLLNQKDVLLGDQEKLITSLESSNDGLKKSAEKFSRENEELQVKVKEYEAIALEESEKCDRLRGQVEALQETEDQLRAQVTKTTEQNRKLTKIVRDKISSRPDLFS